MRLLRELLAEIVKSKVMWSVLWSPINGLRCLIDFCFGVVVFDTRACLDIILDRKMILIYQSICVANGYVVITEALKRRDFGGSVKSRSRRRQSSCALDDIA